MTAPETHTTNGLSDQLSPESALKILFATDGSAEAEKAAQLLQKLPLPPGSSIHVLTVTAGAEWTMPAWFVTGEHTWGESVSAKGAAALRRAGVTTTGAARSGAVSYEIIQAAEEQEADLVVIGSKGLTGLAGFLLGSAAQNVAKHAHQSVLVARDLRHDLQRIVLAVDDSPHAVQAVGFLARLPLPADAVVQVVQVVRTLQPHAVVAPEFLVEYETALAEAAGEAAVAAQSVAQTACAQLQASRKQAEPLVLRGDPAEEILALARQQEADLIVAGARGTSLIAGLLVGSVADRLLKRAPCSVLLVR
jgi:nucleotide-binding universal stress UspA family protein